jgi:hypothetical protein
MLPDGGTAVLLDGGNDADRPAPPVAWEALAAREAQVLCTSACHPDLYHELCALAVRGELPLGVLAEPVSVEEAAFARAERRRGKRLALPILVPGGR